MNQWPPRCEHEGLEPMKSADEVLDTACRSMETAEVSSETSLQDTVVGAHKYGRYTVGETSGVKW